jgi:4-hydroxyphenylpyruvate dioxygenase-like putative hemolysin
MEKLILPNFWEIHPGLNRDSRNLSEFMNDDKSLKEEAKRTEDLRHELGLEGIVGGLQFIIINTEAYRLEQAAMEALKFTGHDIVETFQDEEYITCVLKLQGSADILVRARKGEENPFREYNQHPKSMALPNARLECLVFETPDIEKYYETQKSRGIRFLTDGIIHRENYSFIQTIPSTFTGNSIGVVEWKNRGVYKDLKDTPLKTSLIKPELEYTKSIGYLDHAATRVRAMERDAAIIEFMELTNYTFDFAIYVESMNSITNVARMKGETFAMVFTSGISPYINDEVSGPTEKFVNNYGTRVHHLAFHTENILETYESLRANGLEFLVELVGSEDEGLRQTFTRPSKNTFLVNEYILRYGDFDGFFTKSNVTLLTKATDNQ